MSGKVFWKIYGLAGVFLLTLVMFVLAGVFSSFPGDEPVLVGLQGFQMGWLDTAALALDTVGGDPVAIILVLVAAVGLMLLRRPADAGMVILSLFPLLIGQELKEIVDRPRPGYQLLGLDPHSFSFPSGHSLYAAIFGGLLIYLANELVPSRLARRWLQGSLAVLSLIHI